MVADDRLRFDFSHYEAVTPAEIAAIEDLANAEILANHAVRHFETSKDEAESLGAIAFFGDKYGERVRVLEAGPHSVELCGGTHVQALGDIGPVKIISETSIGSNIRRIEAVSGTGPVDRLREREDTLAALADQLGVPVDALADGVDKRLAELKSLKDEVKRLQSNLAAGAADALVEQVADGVLVAHVESTSRDELRELAVSLRDRPGVDAVVLGSSPGGKGAALVAAVDSGSGLLAGALISEAARIIGGGGGKGDDIAVAGGKNPEQIDEALDHVRSALADR